MNTNKSDIKLGWGVVGMGGGNLRGSERGIEEKTHNESD